MGVKCRSKFEQLPTYDFGLLKGVGGMCLRCPTLSFAETAESCQGLWSEGHLLRLRPTARRDFHDLIESLELTGHFEEAASRELLDAGRRLAELKEGRKPKYRYRRSRIHVLNTVTHDCP
ncbi:hypothetical protein HBI56_219630 [Parastagonospora nodorum]|nr:hypothetical protein HBI10_231520 [Parastagonospora nodorum]KAH4009237.1 hypothetical protein HBI13_222320 [Parastagonospora nodorum]KAH5057085.1 hypothetical protein HBI73_217830 [Parastagonospora nodorum]KAH5346095.1 hypothetical protein HBI49_212440 [Parastagonospora nodorum]KAH5668484.1 hypothetical protein HBI44_218690 [Parastagonospora nodorum]